MEKRSKKIERSTPDFENTLKYAAIRSVVLAFCKILIYHKYYRPRSHRVEVAASGDPRTNGDSTFYYHYYYQKKQSNGATSTPDEFKPPNAKIAAPCVSAFGNRLTHSSTIQHRKLRSPLEHDRLCFRDKRRNPKLNLPQSRYLCEHSGNTHANMLNALESILDLIAPENTNAYASRHKRVFFYLARTGKKKSFYA
ncbi:hypothetical protein V1477_018329 [Vespula maculifrons]|uniref:Uncharacterized protein n=1 Tax=Vespula maculifrons TaxID=7453 RepID=A0ABD2AZ50_VESMC